MGRYMKHAAIIGVTGYTGAEAVRLLAGHPNIMIKAITGHSRAGQPLAALYPNFAELGLPDVVTIDDVDWNDIDVVFACLPHGASQETIGAVIDKVETVIDLSADFRLKDPKLYEQTYGRSHDYPGLLDKAVYGLTEFAREDLPGASLVACPGCYPTCSLLSLIPAFDAEMIQNDIIIDAKSGVTGAGRKAVDGLIYSEVADGAHAYGVGVHRHAPEIDQYLSQVSGGDVQVTFTPHLIPMNRGMITTSYVSLKPGYSIDDLRQVYERRYADEPFVTIMPEGQVPHTRHVRGSNMARIGIFGDRVEGRAVIIAVIDNLAKGSSGQAVQNYNIVQGWDESMGLTGRPLFP